MTNHDLLWVLSSDHREIENLFNEIDTAPVGDERRRELVDRLTTVTVRHATVEERYLYPLVRDRLDQGEYLADRAVADHADLEVMLRELEGLPADEARFDDLVARVRLDGAEHVAYEEHDLLPKVAAACPPEELDLLGGKALRAQDVAPSLRDAPHRPESGPGLVGRVGRALTELSEE